MPSCSLAFGISPTILAKPVSGSTLIGRDSESEGLLELELEAMIPLIEFNLLLMKRRRMRLEGMIMVV